MDIFHNTIQYKIFISLSPYTWHHEIYTSILDKDIIEAYKSDCFYNSRNVDFTYISIQEYEVVSVLVIAPRRANLRHRFRLILGTIKIETINVRFA